MCLRGERNIVSLTQRYLRMPRVTTTVVFHRDPMLVPGIRCLIGRDPISDPVRITKVAI